MDDDAIARLRSVITKLSRRMNVTATQEDLTPAQASILGVIVSHGPIGLGELAEIEGVHPTMLSRVVGKLVGGELIVREQDPEDLRSITVRATRAGRAKHQRVRAAKSATVAACVAELSPAEERALLAALPALEVLATRLQAVAPG